MDLLTYLLEGLVATPARKAPMTLFNLTLSTADFAASLIRSPVWYLPLWYHRNTHSHTHLVQISTAFLCGLNTLGQKVVGLFFCGHSVVAQRATCVLIHCVPKNAPPHSDDDFVKS